MTLERLARELDVTADNSARMAADLADGMRLLSTLPDTEDRQPLRRAISTLIIALQEQDRIEQRCRNLADAARQFAVFSVPDAAYAETIWAKMNLDELRSPDWDRPVGSGEAELF